MFNSFGNILRLTSFGESHGKGIGGVIDGFPAGITLHAKRPTKWNSSQVSSKASRQAAPSGSSCGTKTSTPATTTT